jgi:hypothetical protein
MISFNNLLLGVLQLIFQFQLQWNQVGLVIEMLVYKIINQMISKYKNSEGLLQINNCNFRKTMNSFQFVLK